MDINQAIIKYGTNAVLRYRDVAGLQCDNEMPEIFLGGFIACGIRDELKLHAHIERHYTDIARDLNKKTDNLKSIGGHAVDIAIYRDGRPVAIVELKKYDEGKWDRNIIEDRDKMKKFKKQCDIECYLGVLVTDVATENCTDRARNLGVELELEFVIGDKQRSNKCKGDYWEWCFVSSRIA